MGNEPNEVHHDKDIETQSHEKWLDYVSCSDESFYVHLPFVQRGIGLDAEAVY